MDSFKLSLEDFPAGVPELLKEADGLKALRQIDEALKKLSAAHDGILLKYDSNSPQVAFIVMKRGDGWFALNKFLTSECQQLSWANAAYRRSLGLMEMQEGADPLSPCLLSILKRVIACLDQDSKYQEANAYFDRYLDILSLNHLSSGVFNEEEEQFPAGVSALLKDAEGFKELRKTDEVEKSYKEAAAIIESKMGPDHLQAAFIYAKLGDHFMSLRNIWKGADEAPSVTGQRYYRRALAITEVRLDPLAPQLLPILKRCVSALDQFPNHPQSTLLVDRYREVLEYNRRGAGPVGSEEPADNGADSSSAAGSNPKREV